MRFEKPIDYPNLIDISKYMQDNISFNLTGPNQRTMFHTEDLLITFPELYSEVEGVLTFRGNALRDAPAYGKVKEGSSSLAVSWDFQTSSSSNWGGGAGWTGQPVLIQWNDDVKQVMNLHVI